MFVLRFRFVPRLESSLDHCVVMFTLPFVWSCVVYIASGHLCIYMSQPLHGASHISIAFKLSSKSLTDLIRIISRTT
ncbi:hypothetical protein K456DRAFT_1582971 [Colletotrichum gloeosporioides 23]|nr:hypothetical protein K456DRAFT_1582971 [Colletotrichum gloeosporioides 23]